ncbi:MAG TPA: hypothetical protein VHC69_33370 [Polyangiaceae bacterium]|nr:hypothetical protein [Polyangiaceae bacterium]
MAQVNPTNAPLLLVVEGCAACLLWPAHLGVAPEEGWAVLEQEEWESLPAFAARLGETLSRATASNDDGPLVVTLVTSHHWDAVAVAARRRLALDVLAHLAGGAGGSLVLTHGHQHDASCRDGLVALAGELSPEWADARVAVSARFDERIRRDVRKSSSPSVVAQTVAT